MAYGTGKMESAFGKKFFTIGLKRHTILLRKICIHKLCIHLMHN